MPVFSGPFAAGDSEAGERLQMVVKHLAVSDDDKQYEVMSDPAKIGRVAYHWELKPDADGAYTLDTDAWARPRQLSAGAFRGFTGFEVNIRHKKVDGATVTSARFRLHDGTNPVYWNGSAWVTATSQWNTEAEIANNINAFVAPRTNGGVWGVEMNLQTTDAKVTPEVHDIKFGVNLKVHSWLEDYMFRSLAQDLKAKLRPVTDFLWTMPATGTMIDITAMLAETGIPFTPRGVETAFNRTDDPTFTTDLASVYDPNTKILTLSSSVASGKVVQVGLIYEPEVIVQMTHQDFNEVEKIPAVIINSIDLGRAAPLQQEDWVLNKETNIALVVPPPYQGSVSFKIDVLTPGAIDLVRLSEAIMDYAENNPMLLSKALGEPFRFWLKEEFTNDSRPGSSDVNTARASAELCDVVLYKRGARSGNGVMAVQLTGDMDATGPFP